MGGASQPLGKVLLGRELICFSGELRNEVGQIGRRSQGGHEATSAEASFLAGGFIDPTVLYSPCQLRDRFLQSLVQSVHNVDAVGLRV